MDSKELAVRLVRVGLDAHRRGQDYAIANTDTEVRGAGNAAVAATLEILGQHGIVTDVQPWIDETGIGFAYKTARLPDMYAGDNGVAQWVVASLGPSRSDTARAVAELRRDCEMVVTNRTYAEDLLASLGELDACFEHDCYIACLALSGKILEIALKQLLMDHQIQFDDGWMIGRLLRVVRENSIPRYLDPSLHQISEIINRSRIPAVHAVERVPVPSREQAAMVINAVIETVRRTVIAS